MAAVTLLVGGSIAAYKAAELTRLLTAKGHSVQIAMSSSAQEFITALTLQTLSGNPVATELFDLQQESEIGHIRLADEADIVLVAPATAAILAKAAHGMADDLLLSILLASKAPLLFAPAMNVNMWENPLTQQNVLKLKELGHSFVEPESGELACGWIGQGRLSALEKIVEAVEDTMQHRQKQTGNTLRGTRAVVTAGPTREYLDPIRFLSNRSSGKMGVALAEELSAQGADVTLIHGPLKEKIVEGRFRCLAVEGAQEMEEVLFEELLRVSNHQRQELYMAAAVADYRPSQRLGEKLRSNKSQDLELRFIPNTDILKSACERRDEIEAASGMSLCVIGFAAESGPEESSLVERAEAKLLAKGADYLVANFIEEAFESDSSRVWLLDKRSEKTIIGPSSKRLLARGIIEAVHAR